MVEEQLSETHPLFLYTKFNIHEGVNIFYIGCHRHVVSLLASIKNLLQKKNKTKQKNKQTKNKKQLFSVEKNVKIK